MPYVPVTQRRNEVEVSVRLCDVVCDVSGLKTPQKDIGRCDFTVQAMRCALLSICHVCNLTHTEASEIIKRVWYDAENDSDHRGMKIIWFKNIFRVSPMGMIPRDVSKNDRSDPTTVKSRKKQNLTLVVGVGKYRSPYSPSISLTAALNNHK